VVHFDLPSRGEDFIHRSGRCGRAGKKGTSIALSTKGDRSTFYMIKRETNIQFKTKPLPNLNEILKNAPNSVISKIESVEDEISEYFKEQAQLFIDEKGAEGVARALAYISGLKDFKKRSLLTHSEGFSSLLIKSSSLSQSPRESDVISWLLDIGVPMGMAKGYCRTQSGAAVVDVPSELIEQLEQNQKDNPKFSIEIIQILPPLVPSMSSGSSSVNRGNFRLNTGGNYRSGGYRDNNYSRDNNNGYRNNYSRDNNNYSRDNNNYSRDNNNGYRDNNYSRDRDNSYNRKSDYSGKNGDDNRSRLKFNISSSDSSSESRGNSSELNKKYDEYFNF